jgi:beta-fructofuranosidase
MYPLLVMTLLGQATAQPSTSISSIIPTGVPISGKYDGPLRPQIHFSPPVGFMNDPNGMFVDGEGLHHLYYQYNPNATIAGNQHWGHATSMDLYHWTNQAIALFPENSTQGIFTGSCVVDVNNTSGFFHNQTNGVVAIYTLNGPDEEVQEIAYSTDGGYSFTKYSGNPVLSANSINFRDPKVIWHAETSRWVMAVSYATEFTIGLFTSTNLKSWTHASNFTHVGLQGLQYECPNLIPIPVASAGGSDPQMYILYWGINPGAPLGGSIAQYIPGTFNGTHFTAVDAAARIADFGKDNYAGQFFLGYSGTENQVSIAWASNWEYCNNVPTGPQEGWQSAMSLPRINYLRNTGRLGWELVSEPYNISAVTPSTSLSSNTNLGNGSIVATLEASGSGVIMINASITSLNVSSISAIASMNITLISSSTGEMLTAGQFLQSGTFWMDRGHTSFEDVFFTDKVSTTLVMEDSWDMVMVVDRSIWEVFLNQGSSSATMTFFPAGVLDTIVVRTSGVNKGAKVSVSIYELDSAWASEENGNGVVIGNSTQSVRRSVDYQH